MSWLAKINLNTVVARLGTFRSALLLILLIITCLFCGYRLGNFFHHYQALTLTQQKHRLEGLYEKQSEQVKRIHTLEVELEVERLASQKSQQLLKEIEQQHYQVKKELAFYEKVMAPEKQADGLVIDNVAIFESSSPQHFRFEVALVQQRIRKRYAKGYIELAFTGNLQGKPHTVKLPKISQLTRKELTFSFQYFQIINGEFTFPDGFTPDKMTLTTVLSKSRWQKYQRLDERYDWQKILENNQQTSTLKLD